MILSLNHVCTDCLSPNIFFSRKKGMYCCEDCRQYFLEPKEQENSLSGFFMSGASEEMRELYAPDPEYARLLVTYGADIQKATEGAIHDLASFVRYKSRQEEAEKIVLERKNI